MSMAPERFTARVEAATIRLTKMGGQGVLVPGGFILTAAHCIDWAGTGGMALGDHFVEKVRTRDGRKFLAEVYAVEPVADIAALGAPDGQVLYDDCEAFETFAEDTPAVALFPRAVEVDENLRIYVRGHKGNWITGRATRYGLPGKPPNGAVCLHAEQRIVGGDFGGPVVDRFGRLVGLVSWSGEQVEWDGGFRGMTPTPWTALPCWLMNQIARAAKTRCGQMPA